jgi:hypothetical protein
MAPTVLKNRFKPMNHSLNIKHDQFLYFKLIATHQNISFTATPTFDSTLIIDEMIQIVEKMFKSNEREKL